MKKEKYHILEFLKYIVVPIVFVCFVRMFLFTPVVVDGASMAPTLLDEEKVIINKFSTYNRFDVVVFEGNSETLYVKRIIGVGGDELQYKDDTLIINGKAYKEPYLSELKEQITPLNHTGSFTLQELYETKKVPDGYYFVLGDNRIDSMDSRNPYVIGLVKEDQIMGKVEFTYYPFKQLKWVK